MTKCIVSVRGTDRRGCGGCDGDAVAVCVSCIWYVGVVRAWGSGAFPGFVALALGTGTVQAGRSDSQWWQEG